MKKFFIIVFQILLALLFLATLAAGNLQGAENVFAAIIAIGTVLTAVHTATTPKVEYRDEP